MRKSARLSEDGVYRLTLTREWGEGKRVAWIMLNPSTADADVDDPTIRRCIGFSQSWGAGGLIVANLWPYRATKPADLLTAADPCGLCQHAAIAEALVVSDYAIAAWGANAGKMAKEGIARPNVEGMAVRYGKNLWCLGRTKDGHPRHPLYLPDGTPVERFG